MALVAQKHANRCQFSHDNSKLRSLPGKKESFYLILSNYFILGRGRNSGQNIMYISSWRSFAEEFATMFNAEILMWDYGNGLKEEFKIFGGYPGHYLQV